MLTTGLRTVTGAAVGRAGEWIFESAVESVGRVFSLDRPKIPRPNQLDISEVAKSGSTAIEPYDIIPTSQLGQPCEAFEHLVGTQWQLAQLNALATFTWKEFDALERSVRQAPRNTPILVVFTGPPGSGKTDHAREFARFLQIPMVLLNPSNARHLDAHGRSPFAQALHHAETKLCSALILLDEVDAFINMNGSLAAEIRQAVDGTKSLRPHTKIVIVATTAVEDPSHFLGTGLMQRCRDVVAFNYLGEPDRVAFWKKNARGVATTHPTEVHASPTAAAKGVEEDDSVYRQLAVASDGLSQRLLVQVASTALSHHVYRESLKGTTAAQLRAPGLDLYLELLQQARAFNSQLTALRLPGSTPRPAAAAEGPRSKL
eukprot:TRINITY_DN33911_c0_g1_i2.p1 TRINITY_DN33911_c0_g1~~TRINITY_DN33911_c0_g1_i2.p1  ORF type:complete len:374 (+),score=77.13 TRINITY_DN33911_c0_g1_i2:86-1207(+)